MTVTTLALVGSLLLNAALGWAFLTARAAADSWRANFDTQRRLYSELRRMSHRRHPRTGRLLPLGD